MLSFSEIAVIGFTVHEIKQGIVFFGTPGISVTISKVVIDNNDKSTSISSKISLGLY
jgi:hypothetical protein